MDRMLRHVKRRPTTRHVIRSATNSLTLQLTKPAEAPIRDGM
jgi:hypothetical protein